MSTKRVNLIEGVLDVEWTAETRAAAGRGEKRITDPRLLLLPPSDLRSYIERGMADGSLNMDGAIWLAPAIDPVYAE